MGRLVSGMSLLACEEENAVEYRTLLHEFILHDGV